MTDIFLDATDIQSPKPFMWGTAHRSASRAVCTWSVCNLRTWHPYAQCTTLSSIPVCMPGGNNTFFKDVTCFSHSEMGSFPKAKSNKVMQCQHILCKISFTIMGRNVLLGLIQIYAKVLYQLQGYTQTTRCWNWIKKQHKFGNSNDGVHISEVFNFSVAPALIANIIQPFKIMLCSESAGIRLLKANQLFANKFYLLRSKSNIATFSFFLKKDGPLWYLLPIAGSTKDSHRGW